MCMSNDSHKTYYLSSECLCYVAMLNRSNHFNKIVFGMLSKTALAQMINKLIIDTGLK